MNTSVTQLIMENILILVLFLILLWLIILSYYLYQTICHYRKLTYGINKDNLENILNAILDKLDISQDNIDVLKQQIQTLDKESIKHIQKIGILRFNPFTDTGGYQSFILSILNGENSGIVLTLLHSRGADRWYAKNVFKGKGIDYQLSEEELKAIKQAEMFIINKKESLDKNKIKR